MNACWIISLLSDEGEISNGPFVEALDRQLQAWSRINRIEEQWWAIDAFAATPTSDLETLATSLEKFLKNPLARNGDQPARIRAGAGQLSIILVGDVRTSRTRQFMHCLAKLLRLQALDALKGKASFDVELTIHSLLHLPGTLDPSLWEEVYRFFTQIHTLMSDGVVARRPLDTLLLVQEKNSSDENTTGYLGMSDKDVRDLMVQALFHVVVGEGRILDELRQNYHTRYAAIGAASVFYDWEAARDRLAQVLGEDLLSLFRSSRVAPFVDSVSAQAVAQDVSSTQGVTTLYQRLITSTDRPSFTFDSRMWQGAMDRNGRPISPWSFYSKSLLIVYAHSYLTILPFRISEYVKAFMHTTLAKFREFMEGRRVDVWEGTITGVKGLKGTIRDAFSQVLQGKYGDARSLEQIALVADAIKKAYDPAKIEARLASVPEFNQLEVFAVPQFLRSYYEQANDKLEPAEEEILYGNFVERVRQHPMLTALLAVSVLIGILTAFVGYRLLSLLSPGIIDLEAILQHPYLTRGLLFLVPIAVAIFRYHFGVLKFLRKQIYIYLGAVLRHTQTLARRLVTQELVGLFDQARAYCDEVKQWATELGRNLKYPSESTEIYPSTSFQREVFEGFEIPGRPSRPQPPITSTASLLEIGNQQKKYEQFDAGEKNLYLRQTLDHIEERVAVWEKLCETLPPSESGNIVQEIGSRWRVFAKKLYEGMSRYQLDTFLNDDFISIMKSLSFPPISIASGLPKAAVVPEWKYSRREELAKLSPQIPVEPIPGTSLASLAGYRPVQELTSISIVHSIVRDVGRETKDWSDLASLFSAATTTQATEGQVGLTDLVTGEFIPLENEQVRISTLRERFGITEMALLNRSRLDEQDKERLRITDLNLEI